MKKELTILLPARNEARNLNKIVPLLFSLYSRYILEVIIIDDNSTDNTKNVVSKLMEKYSRLRIYRRNSMAGVGLALREGFTRVSKKANFVLMMDCDFLINVPDIAKFITNLKGYDGVAGSRFLNKTSLENYPLPKLLANRTYQFLAKNLLGITHSDLTNNFKLFKKDLLLKVYPYLSARDFAINAELGYYPVLLGAKIAQVPVRWSERTKQMGISKFKILKVGPSYLRVFIDLLITKIKLGRSIRTEYDKVV